MRHHSKVVVACIAAIVLLLPHTNASLRADGPTVGIDGTSFTLNNSDHFLMMVDYFDALDSEDLEDDFEQFSEWGINGIRIFPNWWTVSPDTFAGDTVIDEDGNLRSASLSNLEGTIELAAEYGLVVDLSMSAESVGPADEDPNMYSPTLDYSDYLAGITSLASALSGYDNLMWDVQNEADKPDNGPLGAGLTDGEISDLISAVHNENSSWPVFASMTHSYAGSDAADRADDTDSMVVASHQNQETNWWSGTYLLDDGHYWQHFQAGLSSGA